MTLRRSLVLALAALLTLVAAAAASHAYLAAADEAEAFLDRQQRQLARFVGDRPFASAEAAAIPSIESEDDYVVAVRDHDGHAPRSSHPEIELPRVDTTGFSNFETGATGWRLFTLVLPDRAIQIAQRTEVRKEIAEDGAVNAALPILLSIPAGWIVIALVTTIAFRPLEQTARSVAHREPSDTTPIEPASVPPEVRPLVIAINDLLARQRLAMQKQKDFVAEAAHALRTPLAAMTLQIDNLRAVAIDSRDVERLVDLKSGARRASDLANGLLLLARVDAGAYPATGETGLHSLVTQSIADLTPLAAKRRIDLGLGRCDPVEIRAAEQDLRVLADILIDNAVRYTPPGGRIDVEVAQDGSAVCFSVIDSGPGIPPDELPRMFERFARARDAHAEGSGLGLAIARSIAEKYGFVLELRNRSDRSGLVAQVRFGRPSSLSRS